MRHVLQCFSTVITSDLLALVCKGGILSWESVPEEETLGQWDVDLEAAETTIQIDWIGIQVLLTRCNRHTGNWACLTGRSGSQQMSGS